MSEIKKQEDIIKESEEWATAMHREMVAATLMDPSLIAFRSLALGIPEVEVRRRLEEELCVKYTPGK